MYCKKCNVNVKNDRKVCPHCGMALTPGEVKDGQAKRLRRIIIIASAVAVAVIAFFLCFYFIGRVPPELKGTWYETNGYGTLEFKPNGELVMTASKKPSEGHYSFNSATDEGTIDFDGNKGTFTCDGTTINWGGSVMTKTPVEQIEFDWENMLNQLG